MSTTRYPARFWNVIAVPDTDGATTLTRTYTRRGIVADNAANAINAALEPSAFQVGAMLRAMGMDESQYDWMRNTLLRIFTNQGAS
jgi:hypothetical protein